MTILLSVRGDNGIYRRDFVDVPHRPSIGECLRALGTVARVTDVITQTAEVDLERKNYDLPPVTEFEAEVLAEPLRAQAQQQKGVTVWVS